MWAPGDQVLIRHVLRGRVLHALPVTIVDARPDLLTTWIAPETPIAYPLGLENGALLPLDRWKVELRTWFDPGALDLTVPGRPHMLRLFWEPHGGFRGWYVNLQEPLAWTSRGWDTTDNQLDLWVEPSGEVTWKDEDHLEQAVGHGMFSPEEAIGIRAEARRVIDEWPFPTGWEDWRPDPGWELPELPPGWDAVPD